MQILAGKEENIPKMQTDISFLDQNNQIKLIIDLGSLIPSTSLK